MSVTLTLWSLSNDMAETGETDTTESFIIYINKNIPTTTSKTIRQGGT